MKTNKTSEGKYVTLDDTRLFIVEKGAGYPIILLHGGPGVDHHLFGDYFDELIDKFKLIFVDNRSQGLSDETPPETWTVYQMATDVKNLAKNLGLTKYAVLGHSFGGMIALRNAIEYPGVASHTIISSSLPSMKYTANFRKNLEAIEPVSVREKIKEADELQGKAKTIEDMKFIDKYRMPLQFADPLNPLIEEFLEKTSKTVYFPKMMNYFMNHPLDTEVEDKLNRVTHPCLILGGLHDRTASVEGQVAMANGIPNSTLKIFEHSGHMTFVEENKEYINTIRKFLEKEK